MAYDYGAHGDSSLYPKNGKNKGSMKGDMMHALSCDKILWNPMAGADISGITNGVLANLHCRVMGISLFGTGLEHALPPNTQRQLDALYDAVQQRSTAAVFFVGGFAAKYGYPSTYDTNMAWVRQYLTVKGAFVVDGMEQVRAWPLADGLHFCSSVKPDMVRFWCTILNQAQPLPGQSQALPSPVTATSTSNAAVAVPDLRTSWTSRAASPAVYIAPMAPVEACRA